MDIQTTHTNTLQNNLIVSVSGNNVVADNQTTKIMYAQNLNQPILPQQIQEQPQLISVPNQPFTRDPSDTGSHSSNTIPQETTIPIRNIKADPETLPQSGFENEQPMNQQNESLLQTRDSNFVSEIDLGNVIGSQKSGAEQSTTTSNSNEEVKDTTSNVNLKSEAVGDFNAFHEQIQTVDPVLLWSMVRSRVVPVVSLK